MLQSLTHRVESLSHWDTLSLLQLHIVNPHESRYQSIMLSNHAIERSVALQAQP